MHNHDAMDDRIALAKAASHSAQKSILKYLAKLKVYSATHCNCFKVQASEEKLNYQLPQQIII